jgi:hypothetical protein
LKVILILKKRQVYSKFSPPGDKGGHLLTGGGKTTLYIKVSIAVSRQGPYRSGQSVKTKVSTNVVLTAAIRRGFSQGSSCGSNPK